MAITRRSLAALGASVLAASRPGLAADWPADRPADRPIMVVVPFPPGGGVDGMARVVLPFVRKHLPGATFVVENRPGAGSQLGLEAAFAAKPDGYTLCAVSSPVLMTMPYERRVRYRVADFTYIAQVVDDPGALWVRKASPISDLGDLLDRAGKNPGGLGFGTTGIGSDDHLLQLEIEQAKPGLSFNHVPFNGQAPLQTALLGGHIDVGCFNISEGIAGHRDGILRCLGQAAAERDPSLPDVPTFSELGVKVVAGAQRGILAPPGLPEPIAAKLTEAFAAAIADPGFQEEARRLQLPVHGLVGAEFRRSVLGLDARLNEMWARKPWRDQ